MDEPYWLGRSAALEQTLAAPAAATSRWRDSAYVEATNPTGAPFLLGLVRRALGYDASAVEHLSLAEPVAPRLLLGMRGALGIVSVAAAWLLCWRLAHSVGIAAALMLAIHFALLKFWHESLHSVMAEAPLFWVTALALSVWFWVLRVIDRCEWQRLPLAALLLGVALGPAISVKLTSAFLFAGTVAGALLLLAWHRAPILTFVMLPFTVGAAAFLTFVAITPSIWGGPFERPIIIFNLLSMANTGYLSAGVSIGISPLHGPDHLRTILKRIVEEPQFALLPNWASIPLIVFGTGWYAYHRNRLACATAALFATLVLLNASAKTVYWDRYSFFTVLGMHGLISLGAAAVVAAALRGRTLSDVPAARPIVPLSSRARQRLTWATLVSAPLALLLSAALLLSLMRTAEARRLQAETSTTTEPCRAQQVWLALLARDPMGYDLQRRITLTESISGKLAEWSQSTSTCGYANVLRALALWSEATSPEVRQFGQQAGDQLAEMPQAIPPSSWQIIDAQQQPVANSEDASRLILLNPTYLALAQVLAPVDGTYVLTLQAERSRHGPTVFEVILNGQTVDLLTLEAGSSDTALVQREFPLSAGVHQLGLRFVSDQFDPARGIDQNGVVRAGWFWKVSETVQLSWSDDTSGLAQGSISVAHPGIYQLRLPAAGDSTPTVVVDATLQPVERNGDVYISRFGLTAGTHALGVTWGPITPDRRPDLARVRTEIFGQQWLREGDGWRGGVVIGGDEFSTGGQLSSEMSASASWVSAALNPLTGNYWKSSDQFGGFVELRNTSAVSATVEVLLNDTFWGVLTVPPTGAGAQRLELPVVLLQNGAQRMVLRQTGGVPGVSIQQAGLISVPQEPITQTPRPRLVNARQFSWEPTHRAAVHVDRIGGVQLAAGGVIDYEYNFGGGWRKLRVLSRKGALSLNLDGRTLAPSATRSMNGWTETTYWQPVAEGKGHMELRTTQDDTILYVEIQ